MRLAVISVLSLGVLACEVIVDPIEVELITPDSATASSEWSSSYAVEHTIDGSGLPAGFGPDAEHADYAQGNHWTTGDGDVEGAWARYVFDAPQSMDTFLMWNHRSTTSLAFSENYPVTRFDLVLYDGDDEVLLELSGQDADPRVAHAQSYSFDPVDGVAAAEFTVLSNAGEPRVTGLAEVRFGLSR